MEPKQAGQKVNGILEAIAAGRTCEQILARDRTLTYHDIFHAVAEAPTTYWEKSGRSAGVKSSETARPARTTFRHRTD
jgi:hypothetical protein